MLLLLLLGRGPVRRAHSGKYDEAAEGCYGRAVEAASTTTNGSAIASLVLGIAGLVVFPLLGVIALVFGYRARREIAARGEAGAGLATAGIVLGWIGTALTVLLVVGLVIFIIFAVAVGT